MRFLPAKDPRPLHVHSLLCLVLPCPALSCLVLPCPALSCLAVVKYQPALDILSHFLDYVGAASPQQEAYTQSGTPRLTPETCSHRSRCAHAWT
jgi:hypothetical protein